MARSRRSHPVRWGVPSHPRLDVFTGGFRKSAGNAASHLGAGVRGVDGSVRPLGGDIALHYLELHASALGVSIRSGLCWGTGGVPVERVAWRSIRELQNTAQATC